MTRSALLPIGSARWRCSPRWSRARLPMSAMTRHRSLRDVRDARPGPPRSGLDGPRLATTQVVMLVQGQCRGRPAGEPDELGEDQGDQQDTDEASRRPREVPSSSGANPCGPMLSLVAICGTTARTASGTCFGSFSRLPEIDDRVCAVGSGLSLGRRATAGSRFALAKREPVE